MSMLRRLAVLCCLSLVTVSPLLAKADDDLKADAKQDAHDTKRAVKKAGNRVDEAGCTASKAECEKRKAGHRIGETKDKANDKVDETADKVRDDTK